MVNPQRELDGRSLYTCHCRNALVGAEVETQGSQVDAPGGYLLQPDLRHPPCGNSSHHTSLAFVSNSTDLVSHFPQGDVNKIRSGRQKKLVFHPALINQDILD